MFKITEKIFSELVKTFMLVFLIITSVAVFQQSLKIFMAIENGISIYFILKAIAFSIPQIINFILPFIITITTILVFNSLKKDRQILIYWSIGLSNIQISKPSLFFSFIIMIISLINNIFLLPISISELKELTFDIKQNYINSFIHKKSFNHLSQNLVLYSDDKYQNGSYKDIILFEFKDNLAIFIAKSGNFSIASDIVFNLKHGMRHTLDKNNNPQFLSFEELNFSILAPKNFNKRTKDIKEKAISELFYPDKDLDEIKKHKHYVEANSRIINSILCFSLPYLILSIFLMTNYKRNEGMYSIICCFLIALLLIIMINIFFSLAIKQYLYNYVPYLLICTSLILSSIFYKKA
jgi:lipopolysaccharide export system permease protein